MSNKTTSTSQLDMIDQELALAILERVYKNCHETPISASYETLTSYIQYRKERHFIQRGLLIALLIFVLLLPLCFISPKYELSKSQNKAGEPVYLLEVSSPIPIKSISVVEEDHDIPVYQRDHRAYEFQSMWDSDLLITITLWNNQYNTVEIQKE